jgi:hypothetical protein
MSRYLAHLLIATLLLAGGMAGFNGWLDPYAIYRDHEGEAGDRPLVVMSERVFKTVHLARSPADVVFIGSSRTDIGIGREHGLPAGLRVHNLATFGQPIRETLRLMELAITEGKARTVVIGLDFFAFNANFVVPSDYVEENYDPLRPYALLLSVSALNDSWMKYRLQTTPAGSCCYADGFRTPLNLNILRGIYRPQFIANERMYLMEKYLPYPACSFTLTGRNGADQMDDFRQMLRLAHDHQVELRFFISPSHARQWETLAAAGLWEQWEDWKRQLVSINQKEAARAGRPPAALWDFSGYDAISTEDVPKQGDVSRAMRWYSDSSHYTTELGQHVVRRMFDTPDTASNWGLRLESTNVEPHLAGIRAARQQYRVTHPEDIAEIERTAREVEQVKHCPSHSGENL